MYRILRGDILSFCKHYRGPLFHGVLCDPPYHLTSGEPPTWSVKFGEERTEEDRKNRRAYNKSRSGGFMGKKWDGGDIAFDPETWSAISSLLYPGAMLLAFGGSRTSHRLACAIEDAGFEIRDSIVWAYGSGFPKSHDVSKAIDADAGAEREVIGKNKNVIGRTDGGIWGDGIERPWKDRVRSGEYDNSYITAPATPTAAQWSGYGTALKPAFEPIILSRKPFERGATVAETARKYGTGTLNIDGSRIACEDKSAFPAGVVSKTESVFGGGSGRYDDRPRGIDSSPQGRWPANLLHDGSAEVTAMFPETTQNGYRVNPSTQSGSIFHNNSGAGERGFSDSGSASRFFKSCPPDDEVITRLVYRAKASRKERDAGLVGMPASLPHAAYGQFNGDENHETNMNGQQRNTHATVKPISLTRYLARLICPPPLAEPRRILVPFAGVGSEMIGAMLAGWDEIIGVELDNDREYIPIAKARLTWWADAMRWGHTEIDAILDSFQDDDEDSDEGDGDKWVQASMFD